MKLSTIIHGHQRRLKMLQADAVWHDKVIAHLTAVLLAKGDVDMNGADKEQELVKAGLRKKAGA